MPQSDDKRRGVSVREASRLRATLGSEPSSGYAFHDQVRVDRVERVKPGRPEEPAPQAASHAPRERSFAQTLVGNMTIQDALGEAAEAILAANSQGSTPAQMSWPPLPQVPNELAGTGDEPQPVPATARAEAPRSGIPAKKITSAPPSVTGGGAIWQAMPSLVDSAVPPLAPASAASQAPRSASVPAREAQSVSARHNPPGGYRPSAAELEAEHSHAYGDIRVLKYEALVERNAWEQLNEELARETNLSPPLLLLSIVAQRETLKANQQQEAARLAQQGISAVAKILQLPDASPTALVLGKRLLRKNPGWAPKRSAGAGLSVGMLLGGIAVGTGIGWLVTRLLF